MTGRVSAFQSMGTLDGPGVRFVVFLQGCPLRCICCHNPETWDFNGGSEYTADEVFNKVIRFKEYFAQKGGITLSGGEPLMQADFANEIFTKCKANNINTCLDTSGCIYNDSVASLLEKTDYCMLDIKYTTEEDYRKNVGCSYSLPLAFLGELNKRGIATRIRQVIIPHYNDREEDILRLKEILKGFECVKETELLPFRKLCIEKYGKLGIEFPLADTEETTQEKIEELQSILNAP